jgi:hypothetical protein
MNNRINTRNHNIEILKSLGYRKESNTTVFKNGSDFILSPAVAEGTNGRYWIDIREVNLKCINANTLLLVRIVPDLFILKTMKSIEPLLSEKLMGNRPNSGNVWSVHIDLKKSSNSAFIYNIKNIKKESKVELFKKSEIIKSFNALKNSK